MDRVQNMLNHLCCCSIHALCPERFRRPREGNSASGHEAQLIENIGLRREGTSSTPPPRRASYGCAATPINQCAHLSRRGGTSHKYNVRLRKFSGSSCPTIASLSGLQSP